MGRTKTMICVACGLRSPRKGTLCEPCRYQKRKQYHADRYRRLGGYWGWKKRNPGKKGPDRVFRRRGVYRNRNTVRRTFRACQRCGYDEEPRILEVHHKDGNPDNNVLENLLVLCPNCHAIVHLYERISC
jgi:5-methylcytosine-specific restriction endonuclease McrA